MLVHRRWQLRRTGKNMVAMNSEATKTFSVRIPLSLYELMKQRSSDLKVAQNSLVIEGLKARLDSTDASTPDASRCRKTAGP